MRKLHFQRGPLNFSVGPSDVDASEYSMPYLPFFFSICTCILLIIKYFAQVLSFGRRPYTTVPVAFRLPFLSIFTNLEEQECYLPIISGAGTPFPCVPKHSNHCVAYWTLPMTVAHTVYEIDDHVPGGMCTLLSQSHALHICGLLLRISHVPWSVCVSVCALDTPNQVKLKMNESTDTPFGGQTRVDQGTLKKVY